MAAKKWLKAMGGFIYKLLKEGRDEQEAYRYTGVDRFGFDFNSSEQPERFPEFFLLEPGYAPGDPGGDALCPGFYCRFPDRQDSELQGIK